VIATLFAGALLVLAAFGSAWLPAGTPTWGVLAMIAGSALCLAATLGLGASNSHLPRSRALAAFLFAVIVVGFGAPLLLPAESPGGLFVLGLPLRAAIEVYGVGILPLFVLPLVYAFSFRAAGLDDAALVELRRRCAEAMRR
jgi:hypothetical protein